MDSLIQDLRLAFRNLRRNRGYTTVALLTLALGIGANTAVFSMVQAVLLRPLPFPDADRLTVLWGTRTGSDQLLLPVADVDTWRTESRTFDDIGTMRMQSVNLTGGDAPDRLTGSFVTANIFTLLGARTSAGRLFTGVESARATARLVAVLSYNAWRTRFGSDPAMIGRTLTLDGRPYEVVGILAPEFQDPWRAADVWLPLGSSNRNWFDPAVANVWAIGRMRSGTTAAAATRDLDGILAQLAPTAPATVAGLKAAVVPLRTSVTGQSGDALRVLFVFVGALLLIACVNVANLQLARAAARGREMSLRAALGARRGRLMRQLVTESVVLALMGGGIGVLLAVWSTQALVSLAPGGLPAFGPVAVNGPVLLFSLALAIVAGLVFGLAPAWHASRSDLVGALKERGESVAATGGRWDLRGMLVGVELALCIALLVGAGLLLRSLVALQRVNVGFDADHLLTAEFRLPAVKYDTPEAISTFMTQAIDRIRSTPGIRSAALVRSVPLSGNFGLVNYAVDGRPVPRGSVTPTALENDITPGFFATMGVPILQGRDFDLSDRAGSGMVAIVNDVLAEREWPGQSALGQRLKLFGPPDDWATVVGVVPTIKQRAIGEAPQPELYRPIAQQPYIFTSVVARSEGDPAGMVKALRAAIWSVDPNQPVWAIVAMTRFTGAQFDTPRFTLSLTGIAAVLALLLASIGVYGVMVYVTEQRRREVGIRMAVGADRSAIVALFLRRGGRIVIWGGLAGLLLALAGARLLQSRQQLYGITAFDLPTFVLVPVLLALVALLACFMPAWRAANLDPANVLRTE